MKNLFSNCLATATLLNQKQCHFTFMGLFNRKSDCKECELVLKMSTCSSSQLIDGKDRGGLVTPSDDIDQIVTFLMRNENFKYLF